MQFAQSCQGCISVNSGLVKLVNRINVFHWNHVINIVHVYKYFQMEPVQNFQFLVTVHFNLFALISSFQFYLSYNEDVHNVQSICCTIPSLVIINVFL